MYCCPIECPGKIPQPHHIPGYSGHIPTKRTRNGGTFGRISREVIEDPCVAQAPCPVLAPPMSKCCPEDLCMRNPVGCQDIGCCDPVCCPPPPTFNKPRKPPCPEICCDPCKIMECFPGQSPDCIQPSPRFCCPPQGPPPCQPSFRPNPRGGGGCGQSSPCPPSFRASLRGGGGGGGGCGQQSSPRSCVDELEDYSCRNPCCRPETPPCPPKRSGPTGCFEEPDRFYSCGPNPTNGACSDYEVRAHHLNRGPYACPCKPDPDSQIYRCCEPMSSSYAGHIPGFTFHSTSRTTGKATFGTKQYMNKCFYFNTWTKP